MRITEVIKPTQPKSTMTPAQARVNALKQGVERSRQQLTAERERQRQQRESDRQRKLQQQRTKV